MTLTVSGAATPQPVSKPLEVTGPGDVLGINPQQIIRMHPRPWITDFEPNYLVFVEFYDEDFPWRYTPAAVDGGTHRLPPWLTLFVLKEGEFDRNRKPGRPLFSVKVHGDVDFNTLAPPPPQLFAWAHTQITGAIGSGTTPDLAQLDAVLKASPEKGVSRLMSPRRLEPNTAYFAFVVPTYEIGRRSGLGEDIAPTLSGLDVAWPTAREYPIYHEWYFRTAERGDFEELVRRLKPRRRRCADRHPRHGHAVARASAWARCPTRPTGWSASKARWWRRPPRRTASARQAISRRSSRRSSMRRRTRWPRRSSAATIRSWRRRSTAIGTRWSTGSTRRRRRRAGSPGSTPTRAIAPPRASARASIKKNQEAYMREAWRQIGEVLRANEAINRTQLGMLVSEATYVKSVAGLAEVQGLAVTRADVRPRPRQPDDDPPPRRREPADERGLLRLVPQADAAARAWWHAAPSPIAAGRRRSPRWSARSTRVARRPTRRSRCAPPTHGNRLARCCCRVFLAG